MRMRSFQGYTIVTEGETLRKVTFSYITHSAKQCKTTGLRGKLREREGGKGEKEGKRRRKELDKDRGGKGGKKGEEEGSMPGEKQLLCGR